MNCPLIPEKMQSGGCRMASLKPLFWLIRQGHTLRCLCFKDAIRRLPDGILFDEYSFLKKGSHSDPDFP